MAPPSADRKRPFEAEGQEDWVPLGPPSLSSNQPPAKAARVKAENSCHRGHGTTASQEVINLLGDGDGQSNFDDEIEFVKEIKPKKKSVRFSEIEHEVLYFQRSERVSPQLAAIDENDEASVHPSEQGSVRSSAIHPSSEHSRATADFTVISSRHGRARRQLRRISKHDLKAAIKYGKKTRQHNGRWKVVHNGLVYITDATMKKEITSFREAITIEPYPISPQMMERHTEVKRILNEEPYLCSGHTYIILDQSGSMRNSDVDGFKSRSHAAYGTLSLEFIAEQLSQRPNQADLFAESVTVVEMRDEGRAVFERVPFDWILFNRLLQRPNVARPSYNGNYNESLRLVRHMIMKEYNSLMEDGAEHDDLPMFNLVFLSDGRPSDQKKGHAEERTEILKTLVGTIKDKFSLYAMGIGARDTEFGVLQLLVNTVTESGGNSQFVHAGLSTVKCFSEGTYS